MATMPTSASQLIQVRDALFNVCFATERAAEAVERLEEVCPETDGKLDPSGFYVGTQGVEGLALADARWQDHVPKSRLPFVRVAVKRTLALRASVNAACQAIADAAPAMDSASQSVDQRWSTRTITSLRVLQTALVHGRARDISPSALPMVHAGVPAALRAATAPISECIEAVKSAVLVSQGRQSNDLAPIPVDPATGQTAVEEDGGGTQQGVAVNAWTWNLDEVVQCYDRLGPQSLCVQIEELRKAVVSDQEKLFAGKSQARLLVFASVNAAHAARHLPAAIELAKMRLHSSAGDAIVYALEQWLRQLVRLDTLVVRALSMHFRAMENGLWSRVMEAYRSEPPFEWCGQAGCPPYAALAFARSARAQVLFSFFDVVKPRVVAWDEEVHHAFVRAQDEMASGEERELGARLIAAGAFEWFRTKPRLSTQCSDFDWQVLLDRSERLAGRLESEDLGGTSPTGGHGGKQQTLVECSHAEDFAWIVWFGTKYDLTKGNQAESMRALWASWERGGRRNGCGLSEKTIGEKCSSESNDFRLAHVFRGHPLWGTVIRPVSKGVFAMFSPESPMRPTS